MEFYAEIINALIRGSIPLILIAFCGMYSERSGVIHLALEGLLLFGSFFAAAATVFTGHAWVGVGAAILGCVLLNLFYGFLVIRLRADQVVVGMAFNIFALGTTPFLCRILFDDTGGTPLIDAQNLPGLSLLILGFILIVLAYYLFAKTYFGLSIQIAGEKSEILENSGVSLIKTRFLALGIGGVLIGVAGSILSLYLSSGFIRNMSAGRGFVAIAAMIFGKWRPGLTIVACLLFGVLDLVQLHLQGVKWSGVEIPVQLIQMLPYVVTLIIVAGVLGKTKAPTELGQ